MFGKRCRFSQSAVAINSAIVFIVCVAVLPGSVSAGGANISAASVDGTEHPDVVYERLLKSGGVDPNSPSANDTLVMPRNPTPRGGGISNLTRADLFTFEDSDRVLTNDFSDNDLFGQQGVMSKGARALLAEWGDNFDFVAFFVNFTPSRQIGAAFYLGLENDVAGIGLTAFNRRVGFGIPGENVEGYVMMWNVDSWTGGTSSSAFFTRLVLGQEFEHRWAMFLNPLFDGRPLQGENGPCGRSAHWNFRVDGQGSGMEIAEWEGESPAIRRGGTLHFNTDLGGVFSATDLYLMGYLSPEEMDERNSEMRYMTDSANCSSVYSGEISPISSSDIILTSFIRQPDSTESQRHFRTGWVMIHQPGDLPSTTETNRALSILYQHQIDWFDGTLGRGSMDNSLLNALGGDFDGDGDVDKNDYESFFSCSNDPEVDPLPPGCEAFDHDRDKNLTLRDFGAFMRAFDERNCGIRVISSPEDFTVCSGEAVTFSVAADRSHLGVRWMHNGLPISGGQLTKVINPVTPENVGEYRASVIGSCYLAHSDIGHLRTHPPAAIIKQPHTVGACLNGPAEISVEATGFGPLDYQWQFEQVDIPGETDAMLSLEDVTEDDLGNYRCLVSNGCGEITVSEETTLGVAVDISITRQPDGGEVCAGSTIMLFTGANDVATFQWYKDDVAIPGANGAFLFIANAALDDSGIYRVEAHGACNSDVSEDAVVNVIECNGSP